MSASLGKNGESLGVGGGVPVVEMEPGGESWSLEDFAEEPALHPSSCLEAPRSPALPALGTSVSGLLR